jgi:uroporphyrinogen decarboxylase
MSKWSKRKRLEAMINGDKVDRPPVTLWRHWPGDDQDAASLAAAHLRWQKDYDWDLIKVSPSSSYCLVDWGVKDKWEGAAEGTRTYLDRLIQKPEDWGRLEVLDPNEGMLATQMEALQLVANDFKEEVPFLATIFSPLAQAKNLAGQERALTHMRGHPDAFHKGLETITRSILRTIRAAKKRDISGIFYAVQHARYNLLSPSEYQTFGRPYDEQILAAVSDLWLNMVHIHGEKDIMFDLVADYPVQVANWHDRDTGFPLSEGLEEFSGAVCGGVSRWSLLQDSPDEALREAQNALDQTGGRRHMLGVGCVIMTNTPIRNIRGLREFVAKV